MATTNSNDEDDSISSKKDGYANGGRDEEDASLFRWTVQTDENGELVGYESDFTEDYSRKQRATEKENDDSDAESEFSMDSLEHLKLEATAGEDSSSSCSSESGNDSFSDWDCESDSKQPTTYYAGKLLVEDPSEEQLSDEEDLLLHASKTLLLWGPSTTTTDDREKPPSQAFMVKQVLPPKKPLPKPRYHDDEDNDSIGWVPPATLMTFSSHHTIENEEESSSGKESSEDARLFAKEVQPRDTNINSTQSGEQFLVAPSELPLKVFAIPPIITSNSFLMSPHPMFLQEDSDNEEQHHQIVLPSDLAPPVFLPQQDENDMLKLTVTAIPFDLLPAKQDNDRDKVMLDAIPFDVFLGNDKPMVDLNDMVIPLDISQRTRDDFEDHTAIHPLSVAAMPPTLSPPKQEEYHTTSRYSPNFGVIPRLESIPFELDDSKPPPCKYYSISEEEFTAPLVDNSTRPKKAKKKEKERVEQEKKDNEKQLEQKNIENWLTGMDIETESVTFDSSVRSQELSLRAKENVDIPTPPDATAAQVEAPLADDDDASIMSDATSDSIESLKIKRTRKKAKKKKKKKKKKDRFRKRGRRADYEEDSVPDQQPPIVVSERVEAIFTNKELIFAAYDTKQALMEETDSKPIKKSPEKRSKGKEKLKDKSPSKKVAAKDDKEGSPHDDVASKVDEGGTAISDRSRDKTINDINSRSRSKSRGKYNRSRSHSRGRDLLRSKNKLRSRSQKKMKNSDSFWDENIKRILEKSFIDGTESKPEPERKIKRMHSSKRSKEVPKSSASTNGTMPSKDKKAPKRFKNNSAESDEESVRDPVINDSLLRIRIERMKRKISDIRFRSQEEIRYMEQSFDARKADLLIKQRDMDNYEAIAYLQTDTVHYLHEEAKTLKKQLKIYENKISDQISISVELTLESQKVQRKTNEILSVIKHHQQKYEKETSTLDHLNYVHGLIGREIQLAMTT